MGGGASKKSSGPPQPSPPPPSQPLAGASGDMATVTVQVPRGARAGQLVQVRTPHGVTIQCQIPAGIVGSQFQAQYKIPDTGPIVIDEEQTVAKQKLQAVKFPNYWSNGTNPQFEDFTASHIEGFDQMVYVSDEHHQTFQDLLTGTYVNIATQDRECPKGVCPRTRGGCPCVQAGGSPGLPTEYRVRRVIRVEDSEMWARYVNKRDKLYAVRKSQVPSLIERFDPPVKTHEIAAMNRDVFEQLDSQLNEIYLWHGTSVRKALAIAHDDFKIDLAGSNRGTMYGPGAYLAESCTKADEYAKDEQDGFYNGVYALLLCRVVMGRFLYTTEKDEEAGDKVRGGMFDSTLGDREKSVNTYREFVVYDADQLYPEYVVLYTRCHRGDDMDEIEEMLLHPFHMQLPVYWRNFHKDPVREPFHEQVRVRASTRAILQRLVEATYCVLGRRLEIIGARRIENAMIWNKYVRFKKMLKGKLQSSRSDIRRSQTPERLGFAPAEELDGDVSSGHVLTHIHLEQESMEESISISNLEGILNEYFLWHGTSKDGAEAIVKEDFRIPKQDTAEAVHGCRFGYGAYFAEALSKSLKYAKTDNLGAKHVLLCRVLCGDIYYTEATIETDAGLRRQQQGKHSVLAHPKNSTDRLSTDREFIVSNDAQVYPEYIIDLRVLDLDGNSVEEEAIQTIPPPPPGYTLFKCGFCSATFQCPSTASRVQCGNCGVVNETAVNNGD